MGGNGHGQIMTKFPYLSTDPIGLLFEYSRKYLLQIFVPCKLESGQWHPHYAILVRPSRTFSKLSEVARKVLWIQAASTTASEGIFSAAERVLEKMLSFLSNEPANSLVFLHSNMKWLGIGYTGETAMLLSCERPTSVGVKAIVLYYIVWLMCCYFSQCVIKTETRIMTFELRNGNGNFFGTERKFDLRNEEDGNGNNYGKEITAWKRRNGNKNKKAVLSQRWPHDARYISKSWAVAEIAIRNYPRWRLPPSWIYSNQKSAIRSAVPENPPYNQAWSGSDDRLRRYGHSRMLGAYGIPILGGRRGRRGQRWHH